MARDLDSDYLAAISAGLFAPIFLAMLTFKTATKYVWTGVGNLVWDAQTFVGIGSFGELALIREGVDVQADGTSVKLSGIDPALLQECMTDIRLGAPAKIWTGALAPDGTIIGAPYLLFSGQVDQPAVQVGADTISIELALESRMVDLSRPSMRRYTSADQRLQYPTDIGFGWIEQLNDLALVWGQ
jgi:hypothetical protein